MTKRQDHFTQRLCFNIYATNRAFNRFYQAIISESGLTYLKFVILGTLRDDGPLMVSELSARAGVEANTLSPLLKKMAAAGLVTRARAPEDERRVVIGLTEKGQKLLERADEVVAQGFDTLGLDMGETMRAMRYLEDVRARLDASDPPKLHLDPQELSES